jgi:hypothetical protein
MIATMHDVPRLTRATRCHVMNARADLIQCARAEDPIPMQKCEDPDDPLSQQRARIPPFWTPKMWLGGQNEHFVAFPVFCKCVTGEL